MFNAPLYAHYAAVQVVGDLQLTPSRRVHATLRTERGNGLMFDLRMQVSADGGWQTSQQKLSIEADRLGELLELVERAIERMPEA